jgi:hypothetical protein
MFAQAVFRYYRFDRKTSKDPVVCTTGDQAKRVVHDLDRALLDDQQRLLVEFAESNIEITTHDWQFATGALDALRRTGLCYPDVTSSSISACLDWFLARNSRAQAFMSAQARPGGIATRVIQVPRGARGGPSRDPRVGAPPLADVA